jgi:L-aspartate oxidase
VARRTDGGEGAPALDLLIVGSGVAGLSAAVRAAAAPGFRVGIVTKGRLEDSATQWAQGGVAAVLHEHETEAHGGPGAGGADSPALHAEDTVRAGAGLCDRAAVDVLVHEGPARLRELAEMGARFDRGESGRWLLSREGGHSSARVVHAGGAATGAEVERALVAAARSGAAVIREHCVAADLLVDDGRCRGVLTEAGEVRARHTLLATGGAGHVYSVTTNPAQATGDGLAMAMRAGAAVADLEFVQFHPTALHVGEDGHRPLLSEALRGEGALLRDAAGERFVDELQPRDVVAAAIAERCRATGAGHVWLDVSPVADFAARFPTLAGIAAQAGLHPPRDWLPVAPAAHYMCGGVVTDLDGATTLPGLWAAGEVACTGVHGANRLASNSLLEGLVFAARCVEAVLSDKVAADATGALLPLLDPARLAPGGVGAQRLAPVVPPVRATGGDGAKVGEAVQRAMTDGVGVERSAASLAAAAAELDALAGAGVPAGEAANLLTVARGILAGATARTESRGGHRRSDYRSPDPALSLRFVQ